MPTERTRLTEDLVIAQGGWHPRYARVIVTATDRDVGFALVDGNGDGAELEEEFDLVAGRGRLRRVWNGAGI